jgi:Ring finger domain
MIVQHVDTTEWSTEQSCIICFDPYEPGDKLARLPCLHSFHEACCNEWFDGTSYTYLHIHTYMHTYIYVYCIVDMLVLARCEW